MKNFSYVLAPRPQKRWGPVLGMSESSVKSYFKSFVKYGFISKSKSSEHNNQTLVEYLFPVPKLGANPLIVKTGRSKKGKINS